MSDETNDDLGIICPNCGAKNYPEDNLPVAQTFTLGPNNSVRRVRTCPYCEHRFNTYERAAGKFSDTSIHTDGE